MSSRPRLAPATDRLPVPADWSVVTLGDVFEVQQGKSLSPRSRAGTGQYPFLRTANVLWARLNLQTLDRMHFSSDERRVLALRPGDLLLCEGGEIGRTAMWRGESEECFYQNHLHRLRARRPGVFPAFVMFWLQAAFVRLGLYGGIANRTTIPNLSASRLRELPIPMPSESEQRAISVVLELLQAAEQTASDTLVTLQRLKAAVMAKLFRDGLRGEPRKATEIGEIPEGWSVIRLGDVTTRVNYGTSIRCTPHGPGSPVLRIPNVVRDRVDTTELKYAEVSRAEADKLALTSGDLLFVRTNGNRAYIGRCAVYRGDPAEALFASYLIRVTVDFARVLPEFVQSYLSQLGRDQLLAAASAASDGKYNIDTGGLRGLLIPLPDHSEQEDIVRTVQSIDSRLLLARSQAQAYGALFTSMLDTLMTGKVRLSPRLIGKLSLRATAMAPKPQGKVDERVVQEAVRRIVEAVTPERIILFGSAARGEMRPDSDLDFLVVKAGMPVRDAYRAIRDRLRGIGVPIDIIVVPPETVERYRDIVGHIVRPALREGRVVYAA